jgi:hypothetical protein
MGLKMKDNFKLPKLADATAEWKALQEIKKLVPRFDRYRVDQRAMIAAQIETLSGQLTSDEIDAHWPALEYGDQRSAAQDALFWAQGGDIPAPSDCWKGVLVAKNSA